MAVYGMKVFAGNSNAALSKSICEILEIPLGKSGAGRQKAIKLSNSLPGMNLKGNRL